MLGTVFPLPFSDGENPYGSDMGIGNKDLGWARFQNGYRQVRKKRCSWPRLDEAGIDHISLRQGIFRIGLGKQ